MSANNLVANFDERRSGQSDSAAILIDSHCSPVSASTEALRVLLYPRKIPPNGKGLRLASQRLRALFPAGPLLEETAQEGEFFSGRRRYLYRVYRFGDSLPNRHAPAAVVVLERCVSPLAPPASLVPYHLTIREGQVLRLVLMGLSNKQIAGRMGISPNTVKVFLHLIMTKMEVTSRFGILRKLLSRTQLPGQAALDAPDASATGFGKVQQI